MIFFGQGTWYSSLLPISDISTSTDSLTPPLASSWCGQSACAAQGSLSSLPSKPPAQ